ncbi:MAG: radical SAM/SPASM domain-containing protein [Candidatus Ventricola sp.]
MPLTNQIEQYMEAQARRRRMPLNAKLELLPVCNLNCRMCYIRTDMETVRAQGGLLPVETWLSLARELRDAGTLFLLLTGGEVFLYPEFETLYMQLIEMGFSITLNTNATLIDEKVMTWLAKRPPQLVSISLYGASDETYEALCGQKNAFTKVDHAIKLLLENGIRVELKTMLNPLNVHDAQAIVDYARAKNVFYEASSYAFPPVRKCDGSEAYRFGPQEAAEQMLENNRRMRGMQGYVEAVAANLREYANTPEAGENDLYGFTCGAGNSSCWVTWQGKLTPCGMIMEPCTLPLERGFAEAWAELKEKCDRILMSPKCTRCDKREVCIVCPAGNLAETGSFEKASPFHCEMTECSLNMARHAAEGWGIDVRALLERKEKKA